MAIAFVDKSTNSASSNDANVTINLPAGAAAGQWAIVAVSYKNQATRSGITAGWSLVSLSGSAANNTSVVYAKKLVGGETSFGFTLSTGIRWAAVCSVYSGVDSVGVNTQADSGLTTSTTAVVGPAITPVNADTMRLAVGGVRGSTNVSVTYDSTPANFNLRGQASSSGATTNVAAAIYDSQLTGQSGVLQAAVSATVSDASAYASHSIILVPATASSTPTPDGETLTHALNRVAGTVGLEAQGAAQVWAEAPGMDLLGCLNKKNGTSGVGLLGVLNSLAGTTALDVEGAAAHLV